LRVITPGRPQQGWSKECRCTGSGNGGGGCGAVLLVEQPDLYLTFQSDYGGGRETFVTFRCVGCGVETDIDDVPWSVRGELPSKRDWETRRANAAMANAVHIDNRDAAASCPWEPTDGPTGPSTGSDDPEDYPDPHARPRRRGMDL